MSEPREAVNIVAELRGKGAVLIELQVQRIIAQSESEALQEHVAKLDQLIAELEAADAMTLSVDTGAWMGYQGLPTDRTIISGGRACGTNALRKAVLCRVKWRPGPEDRKPDAEKPCGNHVQFAQPNALKPA